MILEIRSEQLQELLNNRMGSSKMEVFIFQRNRRVAL